MSETDRNPQFWRRHARRYDRSVRLLNRRFGEVPAMVGDDLRGRARVLEIAAGTGLVTLELARAASTLVATDRSPEMLDVLRGRIHTAGLHNVEVKDADAVALPFPDRSFDGVVAANVLHLLPDPGRALAEIRRVLRPDGLICAPTFAHGETLLAHGVSRLLALAGFPVVSRFGANSLRLLIENNGFVVVKEALVRGILPVRYLVARL
jgi:phosphatidylethanolamine/phosphatidyl-N-methylethanolamine N-methyltransferase